jgi:hypothetical protein
MENNESKWTTIKVDSMYRLIDPSGYFVASASKLNCDSIASTLNNYQALKEENEELTTQLAKANSDKEKLGELLKELLQKAIEANQSAQDSLNVFGEDIFEEEEKTTAALCEKIHLVLTDCGITL